MGRHRIQGGGRTEQIALRLEPRLLIEIERSRHHFSKGNEKTVSRTQAIRELLRLGLLEIGVRRERSA